MFKDSVSWSTILVKRARTLFRIHKSRQRVHPSVKIIIAPIPADPASVTCQKRHGTVSVPALVVKSKPVHPAGTSAVCSKILPCRLLHFVILLIEPVKAAGNHHIRHLHRGMLCISAKKIRNTADITFPFRRQKQRPAINYPHLLLTAGFQTDTSCRNHRRRYKAKHPFMLQQSSASDRQYPQSLAPPPLTNSIFSNPFSRQHNTTFDGHILSEESEPCFPQNNKEVNAMKHKMILTEPGTPFYSFNKSRSTARIRVVPSQFSGLILPAACSFIRNLQTEEEPFSL